MRDGIHEAIVVVLVGFGAIKRGLEVIERHLVNNLELLATLEHGVAVCVYLRDDVVIGIEEVAVLICGRNVGRNNTRLPSGVLEGGDRLLVLLGGLLRVNGILNAIDAHACVFRSGDIPADLVFVVIVLPSVVGLLELLG